MQQRKKSHMIHQVMDKGLVCLLKCQHSKHSEKMWSMPWSLRKNHSVWSSENLHKFYWKLLPRTLTLELKLQLWNVPPGSKSSTRCCSSSWMPLKEKFPAVVVLDVVVTWLDEEAAAIWGTTTFRKSELIKFTISRDIIFLQAGKTFEGTCWVALPTFLQKELWILPAVETILWDILWNFIIEIVLILHS